MELIDAQEFSRFVAGLPPKYEPDLIDGDAVSTAFFKARQRGWELLVLIAEANRILGSGSAGMGAVVARFRALAEQKPVVRGGSQRPEDVRYRRHEAQGEPTPWEWHKERMELLRRISKGGFTADAAEREMVSLIARQKASANPDPFA